MADITCHAAHAGAAHLAGKAGRDMGSAVTRILELWHRTDEVNAKHELVGLSARPWKFGTR